MRNGTVLVVSNVAFYKYVLILERVEVTAASTLLKSYLPLTVHLLTYNKKGSC